MRLESRSVRVVVPLLAALAATSPLTAQAPGEALDLLVVDRDPATGVMSLQFDPACGAADHHVEYGPLAGVASASYSGQECGIGVTGSYTGFDPGAGSFFFLVVANDGVDVEGSYGTSFVGGVHAERPEDLLDPVCVYVQQLAGRCDVPGVEMTAYRPQSESYGAPLQRRAVPDDQELVPGVGVRVNGDDDDGDTVADASDASVPGENDLVEVVLAVTLPTAPDGLEYALLRTAGDVRVWDSSIKGGEILGASGDAVLSFDGGPRAVWVEQPGVVASGLALVARRTDDGTVVAEDELALFSFTSVVIALGGEGQVAGDPTVDPGNHGMFEVAIELYELGYDVHMYDEDVVAASGAGAAFDEVASAVGDRAVTSVAIFGYSHGGGSTNDLARRLDDNRGTIGTFAIDFTAYVDGIDNDSDIDVGTETALPPSTAFHANWYQNPGCGLFSLCGGPIAGADFDLSVTSTPWGAGLTHFTVDDAPDVTTALRDMLIQQVAP